jgi:hexosaminidase
VDEITAMYKDVAVPIRTFHTGGDEVPKGAWTNSLVCEKSITETEGIILEMTFRITFIPELTRCLKKGASKQQGWEEFGQMEVKEKGIEVIRTNPVFADKIQGICLEFGSWLGWRRYGLPIGQYRL